VPVFLTLSQVVRLHDQQIQRFGGLAGLRDEPLLDSAVKQPETTMFGEFLHPNIPSQAAAYLYHLARNHPFLDGNKRTALDATVTFLRLNGYSWGVPLDEAFRLTLDVATGRVEKGELAERIAAFIGWKSPGLPEQTLLPESDADIWKAVDIHIANTVDDPSKLPIINLMTQSLNRLLLTNGLSAIKFREPNSVLGFEENGNFSISNLTFVGLPSDQFSEVTRLYGIPEQDIQVLDLDNQENSQRFAIIARDTFVRCSLMRLKHYDTAVGPMFGWSIKEEDKSVFQVKGLSITWLHADDKKFWYGFLGIKD
jgi:death-on-curing protein